MKDNLKIAKTLIEALPYIQKFRGKTVVLKFWGSIGSKEFVNFSRDLVLMKFVGIIRSWFMEVGLKSQKLFLAQILKLLLLMD